MPGILSLFPDETTRKVFQTVLKQGRMDVRGLRESLDLSPDQALEILRRLKDAGLLEETMSSMQDFNIYSPTARGLSTERQLKRLV
jgi:predicted transcriptional regulator